ncbi:70-kilodalton heat shock protein [Tulasnella sp. 408]|nr:70-kilodalton heat shock protein [Tulasnella sp. 408]
MSSVSKDYRTLGKFNRQVENAQLTSSQISTKFEIESFKNENGFSEIFTRAKFEELNAFQKVVRHIQRPFLPLFPMFTPNSARHPGGTFSNIPRDISAKPLSAADAGPNGLHHIRQSLEVNQPLDFWCELHHRPFPFGQVQKGLDLQFLDSASPNGSLVRQTLQTTGTLPLHVSSPPPFTPTPSLPAARVTSVLPPAPVPEATLPSHRKLSRRGPDFPVLTTGCHHPGTLFEDYETSSRSPRVNEESIVFENCAPSSRTSASPFVPVRLRSRSARAPTSPSPLNFSGERHYRPSPFGQVQKGLDLQFIHPASPNGSLAPTPTPSPHVAILKKDLPLNTRALRRLRTAREAARTSVEIDSLYEDSTPTPPSSLARFELCQDLFHSKLGPAEKGFRDSKTDRSTVNDIVIEVTHNGEE